jgi:hypothetical protein
MDRVKEFPSASTVRWVCPESAKVKLVYEHTVGALSARGGLLSPTRYVRAAGASGAGYSSPTDTHKYHFSFSASNCGDIRRNVFHALANMYGNRGS